MNELTIPDHDDDGLRELTPSSSRAVEVHPWTRYVALGDSFTEGIGDPLPSGGHRGWADRMAEVLAETQPEFAYANLAVRGRLIDQIRDRVPHAGIRSNFIAGFPGETEDDLAVLKEFMGQARLDVVGVFGYSDEDNTEGATLSGHLDQEEVEARAAELSDLAAELCAQRAEDRVGETTTVLVEGHEDGAAVGRAEFQGPEVDGVTTIPDCDARVGEMLLVSLVDSDGVDLVGEVLA